MDLAERRGMERTVYQPAEDSALLAAAAEDRLHDCELVIEVGTGSGYVAERIGDATGARVVATDRNPHAALAAAERGLETLVGDLLEPFVANAAAAVVFNPPYLPTDPETEWDDWMEVALSGGTSGLAVIEPFLADLDRVLRPDGVALLLVSSLVGVETVMDHAGDVGFSGAVVREQSFPFETLSVLALFR